MTSSDNPPTGSEYPKALAEITEQTMRTINRSQQAVIEAIANWAQITQVMIPQPPSRETLQAMPKPAELVDRAFEIAEQLLAAQHSIAKKLMESVQGPLTDAATETASAAQDLSDAGAASAQAASEGTSEAGASLTQTVKEAFQRS